MPIFSPGQRWISDTEPELGLGIVLKVSARQVSVLFPDGGEMRTYAADSAPLSRARFRPGDAIRDKEGAAMTVEGVEEREGLLVYRGGGRELAEIELSGSIGFGAPENRLVAGRTDESQVFDLRVACLRKDHERRKSEVRGFVGGRIDLIPHQLYIAHEVAGRHAPRVLLADEVGLGKTIEAGLVLHRLYQSGRAARILVLVPESLVHQWFVELLRRFNMWFNIFDEERCMAIETHQRGINPFEEDQLVLCSIGFLAGNPQRAMQVVQAGWDILVVDEAHHLIWSPEAPSPEYGLVEAIGGVTGGLMLLTATPEQLGETSHFARLRLLDPDRYVELDAFMEEADHYRDVARVADKLVSGKKIDKCSSEALFHVFAEQPEMIRERLQAVKKGDQEARDLLLADLLDQHGTGRVMFRNTRSAMSGFPGRKARMAPLDPPDGAFLHELAEEFARETHSGSGVAHPDYDYDRDPRIPWLAELLRELDQEKVLLICRSKEKVLAVEEALARHIQVATATFHEELPLVQRDRQAAWFAEEDGARVLLCSEIGGEGRNFQFAHHLVLFDLPLDPEMLEQRIGRLDRIGQTQTINVHVPYVAKSCQEVLARWFHEGMNAVEKCLEGGQEISEAFEVRVRDLALHPEPKSLDALIADTRQFCATLWKKLEGGRDHLLELNSYRPDAAAGWVERIRAVDADLDADAFALRIFEHFGVTYEAMSNRSYLLQPGHLFTDAFPGLPKEGLEVTFDRQTALEREDFAFLTRDHPMVIGAIEALLGSPGGCSAFALWPDGGAPDILLEMIFLLECVAPPHLFADRFLPPTPIRIVIDHRGEDRTDEFPPACLEGELRDGDPHLLLDNPRLTEEVLPGMIRAGRERADLHAPALAADALQRARTHLGHEVDRLCALQKINDHVRDEEIETAREHLAHLHDSIAASRLRLDALRLIRKGR